MPQHTLSRSVAAAGRFPSGGAVLLLPLTDAQFESALEAHALEVPAFLLPGGPLPPYLGVMRARHAGMLTHWAEIRSVDREGATAERAVRLTIGPLQRFPRPLEWTEQREIYRPLAVEADALARAASLDEIAGPGREDAVAAISQAAHFIEVAPPKLDLSLVDRRTPLDRAANFAAKDPQQAIQQIDLAVTEALRDIATAFYGDSAEGDEDRDGWFGAEKFKPTAEAYFELLREAEEKELAPLLEVVERYLVVKGRAVGVESGVKAQQVVELIAVAQAVLDLASGQRPEG